MKLDEIDLKILRALKEDGRLSNQDLAERISLSPSACHRRVKELENSGIIKGYRAILDEKKLGREIEAFVEIGLMHIDESGHQHFCDHISTLPEVINAYIITGESNYLLHVRTNSFSTFSYFITHKLNKISGIIKIHSKIVISDVKKM